MCGVELGNLKQAADGLMRSLTGCSQELDYTGASRASLRTMIASEISYLLATDLEKLMSVFYRLDVPEGEVKTIFMTSPRNELALSLADVIIDRELRKIVTREQYRSSNASTKANDPDEF